VTAELQASRESIVTAREEERRRIRRDLHDGLGPVLSALQLQLGALRTLVHQDPDAAEALAAELRDEMRAATGEIRRLVYDLRPPMLDEFGLAGAIRTLGAAVPNLALAVDTPEPMPALSAAQEVAFYRIAAEAVHNVIRHSGAACCDVTLAQAGDQLVLTVRDNGSGLSQGRAVGIGFASMRERAQELGGSVSVLSSPDEGTTVSATIPYAPPIDDEE
jgi:two-component system NarL family sensor kinase